MRTHLNITAKNTTQDNVLYSISVNVAQCGWLSAMSGNPHTESSIKSNTISYLYPVLLLLSASSFFLEKKLAGNPLSSNKDLAQCATCILSCLQSTLYLPRVPPSFNDLDFKYETLFPDNLCLSALFTLFAPSSQFFLVFCWIPHSPSSGFLRSFTFALFCAD